MSQKFHLVSLTVYWST